MFNLSISGQIPNKHEKFFINTKQSSFSIFKDKGCGNASCDNVIYKKNNEINIQLNQSKK